MNSQTNLDTNMLVMLCLRSCALHQAPSVYLISCVFVHDNGQRSSDFLKSSAPYFYNNLKALLWYDVAVT